MHRTRHLIFLAALFVFAGVMHFVIPASYVSITPAWVGWRLEAVYLSGFAEIAGGIGLLVPSLRKVAGIGLIALLVAVFPANVQMLSNAIASQESALYQAVLFLRLPLQPLLIIWVYRVAVRSHPADSTIR
jgi:uncharacterized membrane protein